MDFNHLSIDEIKCGYQIEHLEETLTYKCLECNHIFTTDEIYAVDGRFYTAKKAIKHHIESSHGNRLDTLMNLDKKLTSLTDNQREILGLMAAGVSDKTIAKTISISASTVRHLRFSMREKARQAKVFLAIYELALTPNTNGTSEFSCLTNQIVDSSSYVQVHQTATMVDDRYLVTEEEHAKIVSRFFHSLSPLKLKTFSTKEKNKIVILRTIANTLDANASYTEIELNRKLSSIFDDFATLRRYLIEYGFMERSKDGTAYKLRGEI